MTECICNDGWRCNQQSPPRLSADWVTPAKVDEEKGRECSHGENPRKETCRWGRIKGICTLCDKGGPLTFEHVPAEGSGNLCGVMMFGLTEWLARDSISGHRIVNADIASPDGVRRFGEWRAKAVTIDGREQFRRGRPIVVTK